MKAIIFEEYGSPDVLKLADIEKPAPQDNEVLVRIVAAAANPLDWRRMRASPWLVRTSEGWSKPKNPILGADIAGVVEAVGASVTRFRPKDTVFAEIGKGGFAEYVCIGEEHLTQMPTSVSFEAAAAAPVVGLTALQGLRDAAKLQAGEHILINGASGGVGTFAVQLAKSYGAEVTAVCSDRNAELVRSIGADHMIDYAKVNFTRNGQQYDVIYDLVANYTVDDYQRALKPHGRCVVAGFSTMGHMFQLLTKGAWVSRRTGKSIGTMGSAEPNQADMLTLKELLETGSVTPVIDRRYPLTEAADAIRYLETGRARGKVIITISSADPD